MHSRRYEYQYHLMILIPLVLLAVFSIYPMYGSVIAFLDFKPVRGIFGSEFVGLYYFQYMLELPDFYQVLSNTVLISAAKILLGIVVPVVFALLLSEIKHMALKRTVQTIVYLPHFLSWVVLAIPIMNLFAYDGIFNQIRVLFGVEPVMFMSSNRYFRSIVVLTDVWKNFGFGAIVYLSAILAIDPNLYEAATIDGASRMQRVQFITLPCISSTIVLTATLSLGSVLNAGFDQIYNLYSPLVYETGDIIDTYVYRIGLLQMNYSLGTAVGLSKSLVSLTLILTSYALAYRYADYRIF